MRGASKNKRPKGIKVDKGAKVVGKNKMVKKKKHGIGTRVCRRCGSTHGLIRKYGLYYCRRCMREIAKNIGFKKYR